MSKYRFLLFDVDDTLLDFKACEQSALKESLQAFHINYDQNLIDYYQQYNQSLWRDFESGKILRETIFEIRFDHLFQTFQINVDGKQFEAYYRQRLSANHQLMPHALEVLSHLSKKYEIYIVTNGLIQTQYQRLKDSQVDRYVKKIFVSEEIGFKKPSKAYFEYVFDHIEAFDVEKALMIGDSLTSDIQGALQMGMDVCFMNADFKKQTLDVNYEIHDLKQLLTILEE